MRMYYNDGIERKEVYEKCDKAIFEILQFRIKEMLYYIQNLKDNREIFEEEKCPKICSQIILKEVLEMLKIESFNHLCKDSFVDIFK